MITIGNHVRITNGVRFVTHDGGVWVLRNLGLENADIFGKIEISMALPFMKKNEWL